MRKNTVPAAAKVVLAGALGLLGLVSLSAGVTDAWLSASDSTVNTVMAGETDGENIEEYAPENVTPGEDITKNVFYTNTGSLPCFVRAKIVFSSSDAENVCEIYGTDTSKWIYDAETGFYYYTDVLDKNQRTEDLMEGVRIKTEDENGNPISESDLENFEITVYTEAVNHEDHDGECAPEEFMKIWDGR